MTATYILNTGAVCAIGIGAAQCSASFRAGLSGYMQSPIIGRNDEPIVTALVPDADLETLHDSLVTQPLSDRERRMLRLGGMALRQATVALHEPVPLFLALPEPNAGRVAHSQRGFFEHLNVQAESSFDTAASQYFELGRAGSLFALDAAIAALAAGRRQVLVGGIDTCLDLTRLAELDGERRLLGSDVKDGFVPGEGAAFLLLSSSRGSAQRAPTIVRAVGTAQDAGHRYSDEPSLGVGLSHALNDALQKSAALPVLRTCFAGLNGENFGAKEWGVAQLRHHALFDPALIFEHPADCFGDVGAAMGTLLIALSDEILRNAQRPGPILVWASSDRAPCACAYLDSASHT
jgi:3-oxoacyl-[acyl-carrier-protein] synthase-1